MKYNTIMDFICTKEQYKNVESIRVLNYWYQFDVMHLSTSIWINAKERLVTFHVNPKEFSLGFLRSIDFFTEDKHRQYCDSVAKGLLQEMGSIELKNNSLSDNYKLNDKMLRMYIVGTKEYRDRFK